MITNPACNLAGSYCGFNTWCHLHETGAFPLGTIWFDIFVSTKENHGTVRFRAFGFQSMWNIIWKRCFELLWCWGETTGFVRKKLYNFQLLIAEKVNKAQQQHSGGQKHNFPWVRRFSNAVIPWSGVKVMVHRVMSGKNKVGHFCHYYESHGSSPIGETHSDQR